MSATKDFSVQTSAPTTISPSKVVLYADSSNNVLSIVSGGAPVQIGTTYTGVLETAQAGTGMGVLNTGIWIGKPSNEVPMTGLGTPHIFLPVQYNGSGFLVPAYSIR